MTSFVVAALLLVTAGIAYVIGTLWSTPPLPEEVTLADPPADDTPEPPRPSVEMTEPTNPSPESAKQVVKRNYGQLRYCYEAALRSSDRVQGRVEIGWSVDDGIVRETWVVSDDTGSKDLTDCLELRIRRWRFASGASGEMSWPFVFRTE